MASLRSIVLLVVASSGLATEGGFRGSSADVIETMEAEVVASADACQTPLVLLMASQAPGCLDPCMNTGICSAVDSAYSAYMKSHNVDDVKKLVCDDQAPYECLLQPEHIVACQPVFAMVKDLGMYLPESTDELHSQCSGLRSVAVSAEAQAEVAPAAKSPEMNSDVVATASVVGSADSCQTGSVWLLALPVLGCLDPCKNTGVGSAVGSAISAYIKSRNGDDVMKAVCDDQAPFECLLQPEHIFACQPVYAQAKELGILLPESADELHSHCSGLHSVAASALAQSAAKSPEMNSDVVTTASVVASADSCQTGFVRLLASQALGCFDPCKSTGVGSLVGSVISEYLKSRNVDDVLKAVCDDQVSYECLLQPEHIVACQPVYAQAKELGILLPESADELHSQCR